MVQFAIGCTLGAAIIAAIGAPFLAPWPFRVRYLANAQNVDPLLGLGPVPRLDMRVIRLESVEVAAGHLELGLVEEGGRRATSRATVSRPEFAAGEVAKLDGWMAAHTPLLVVIDEDHSVHLFGPDASVTDLTVTKVPVR